jgi:hypothetical protein
VLLDVKSCPGVALKHAAKLSRSKILNPSNLPALAGVTGDTTVLVVLAAGKGTRFGASPKCVQPIDGTPLARHSIDFFRRGNPAPVICLVGYRHDEVAEALGPDNLYVHSENPTGGTAFAVFEAFSVPALREANPLLVITMGDRIVPPAIFRRLRQMHGDDEREADMTFLTADYVPPRNRGKGRILRDGQGRVLRIIEEKDIAAEPDPALRRSLADLTEGNCPLYMVRAATLHRHLQDLTNANAQQQYYLTDVIDSIRRAGGEIRTVTTTAQDLEYDLLCADVTQPMDLALLEGLLASARSVLFPEEQEVAAVAGLLAAGRPAVQTGSIARQLQDLVAAVGRDALGFKSDRPVAIGLAGGRLRIAFMHPDMVRFYGPAWQMPIGAGSPDGDEQIVVMLQGADDGRIHLYPLNPRYRESVNWVSSEEDLMYPGAEVSDPHVYEGFGTRMSERLLLSLGYFSDEELDRRRREGRPLPPPSLWVSNSRRRPFSLVGNALASMRTLRTGNLGSRVDACLGRGRFRGLRLVTTGDIARGGFASSSALTVATKNAINALFDLGIPSDLLVHLASQAEYGTGVRAGSLDQATEQKGLAGQGALISSNPRDNYRIIGTYPVPGDRIRIIFPYTVDRDREAWRWSMGAYGAHSGDGALTTEETRKMTGKAAEIAAVITRLPLDTDYFKLIEDDLVATGAISRDRRAAICTILRQLPLFVTHEELRRRVMEQLDWYLNQLVESEGLDPAAAAAKADGTLSALFAGWRDPRMESPGASKRNGHRPGVPLRAMVAYLFAEVARNFHLVHHPDQWIACVAASQRGDCCFDVDPATLPPRDELERDLDWERGAEGPDRLARWMERCGARPFDFNAGLDDALLDPANPPEFHLLAGSSFFRGLALIDLAEAMLRRAFGADAVAVRVNAAGQGDYFQVHIDTRRAEVDDVKQFLVRAFYRRFGLAPQPPFVEVHPGGPAAGVRLSRFDAIPQLIQRLRKLAQDAAAK